MTCMDTYQNLFTRVLFLNNTSVYVPNLLIMLYILIIGPCNIIVHWRVFCV